MKAGKAYVDDTDAETMKKERETRTESKRRNQGNLLSSTRVQLVICLYWTLFEKVTH